jgi:eukaryotic-like serine/threonine-protein kinase
MSSPGRSTFELCALASGLLTGDQLDEARAGVQRSEGGKTDAWGLPGDQRLADWLVEAGRLNAWQARQLLDGRTKFNLGPYLIVDSIGQGATGQVFKARHEKIGRAVAVKVLPREKSTPEAIANFLHEIRALASLDHPRLVAAVDAGQDGNVYYLVTEYVPGSDLRKFVQNSGPLDMLAAARTISQVAEALEYAHAQGIVHRDVKPGNVLVSPDGDAKLSDLGLAGPLSSTAHTDPRYGKIVGTADYLSPDQINDPFNPTPAWDIYSLGCTLYFAVTGQVPFPGGTTATKISAHCNLQAADPRRFNPTLSADFIAVMAAMMAKKPSIRVASATEVRQRLAPFLSPPSAAAVAPAKPAPSRLPSPQASPRPSPHPSKPHAASSDVWPFALVAVAVFLLGLALMTGVGLMVKWLARLLD